MPQTSKPLAWRWLFECHVISVPSNTAGRPTLASGERAPPLPEYRVAATHGPDHRKTFAVDLCVGDETVAHAEGPTKKAAEQGAAAQALEQLDVQEARPRSPADEID